MTADLSQQFRRARKSGVPLLAVRTSDPAATIAAIGKIPANGNGEPPPILRWDVVKGITHVNKAGEVALQEANIHNPDPDRQEPTVGPVDALIAAERLPEKSILFFSNAHRVINELGVSQAIWNLRDKFKFSGRSLVLLCPSIELPAEIQQDVLVLDEPLPDFQALEKLVRDTFQGLDGSVPQLGDAHPDFAFMFCTDRHCAETGESACALDVIYMGCLTGSESPDLPTQKHSDEKAVQSATSQMNNVGQIATSPVTLQYYAPSTVLEYVSADAAGTDVPSDPSDDPVVITFTLGAASLAIGTTITDIIANFFVTKIIASSRASEIVATKYWQNTARKIKTLAPVALNLPSGAFIELAAPGSGYTLGDSVTITGGSGVAVIVVTQLGIGNSISNYTISSNSCTTADSYISGTGGSGSGSVFNIVIIT